MYKQFTSFIVLLLATGLVCSQKQKTQKEPPFEINLLELQSNWMGKGISVLYPGTLKILTQRLKAQAGSMSTANLVPGGEEWELDFKVKVDCHEEPSDFGVAFWITKNNPNIDNSTYNPANQQNLYGFQSGVDGLSMVYANKQLFTGLMRSDNLSRKDLFYSAKNCKVYMEEGKHMSFRVKYFQRVMGIYVHETNELAENMCIQFHDVDFTDFFLSMSASASGGECTVEFEEVKLIQPKKLFQIIKSEEKKPGDAFYAFFTDLDKTQHYKNWAKNTKLFDLYRENSKVLAKELLEFADMNQKELAEKLNDDLVNQTRVVEDALSIIGDEAKQIELLGDYLEEDKKKTTDDVNDFTDQVIMWLENMEETYRKVDEKTRAIHESIKDIKITDKVKNIIMRSSTVVESLNMLLRSAKNVKEQGNSQNAELEKLLNWNKEFGTMKKEIKKTIKKGSAGTGSTLKNAVMGFLGIIGLLIFFGFGYMYYKIRKAAEHKRIL